MNHKQQLFYGNYKLSENIIFTVKIILRAGSIYFQFFNQQQQFQKQSSSFKQMNQMQNRFLNQQILFKKGSRHQKSHHFDGHSNNLQLNHIDQQQQVFTFAAAPLQSTDKQRVNQCLPSTSRQGQWKRINLHNNDTFLRNSVSKQKIKRALSSKKFDLLTPKQARKKTKKMMPHLFEHMLKKQSTSKKSTDQSSQAPIQNLKAENEQYLEKIRQQEERMKKIKRAIMEQKKLHELQKHMYNHNIQKLKKLAGILVNQEDENEEYDCLSIQSN